MRDVPVLTTGATQSLFGRRLMIPGIYSAASAMEQAAQRHEVVATNLAHVDIPGYRRAMSMQQTFESTLNAAQQQMHTHDSLGTASAGTAIDFTPGHFQVTGNPLDVALQGDGFFAIDGPAGTLYTRNGAFQVNDKGRLVTTDGLPVSADSGNLTLPPDSSPSQLQIQPDGTAIVNGTTIGRIRTARFDDPQRLQHRGVTLFHAPEGVTAQKSTAEMVQGTRERSNVHPVQELVEMISASRAHEAAQKAMHSIHDAIRNHTDLQGR